ncbi:MAG: tetratricopeptide repeat protein, partial [Acidobacteria bacterium]|nr:tetratricopeptide repeat protein [Acidobacteriota bacterium]
LIHLNRGKDHLEKGNFALAEVELIEARRMRPSDEKVLNALGLVYFKQEKYGEADEIYRLLILANPESLPLHFNHGLICFKLGKLDQAEGAFLRALEIKPDNPKIHFYLGNIYERKKQYYNAIFQYRKAGANIMVKRVQAKIASDPSRSVGASALPEETAAPVEEPTVPQLAPVGPVGSSGAVGPAEPLEPLGEDEQRKLRERMVGELLAVTPERSKTDPALPAPAAPTESGEDRKVTVDLIDKKRILATLLGPSPVEGATPPAAQPSPDATAPPGASQTVVRHREPVETDASFAELGRARVLSGAHPGLFAPPSSVAQPPPSAPSTEDTLRVGTPPVIPSGPVLP